MIGAVIITHGDISRSLCEAAEAITGRAEMVKTVSVRSSNSTEDIKGSLYLAVKEADAGAGVIVFTDMFGGTPTNIALPLLEEGKVEVITGVNLPMLLKFIGYRKEKKIGELAAFLREYGRMSIILAGEMLREK